MGGNSIIRVGRDRQGRDFGIDLSQERIIWIQHHDNPLLFELYNTIFTQVILLREYNIKIITYERYNRHIRPVIKKIRYRNNEENAKESKEDLIFYVFDLEEGDLCIFKEYIEELLQDPNVRVVVSKSRFTESIEDIKGKTVIDLSNDGGGYISAMKLYKMPLPILMLGESYIRRSNDLVPNRVMVSKIDTSRHRQEYILNNGRIFGWSFIEIKG